MREKEGMSLSFPQLRRLMSIIFSRVITMPSVSSFMESFSQLLWISFYKAHTHTLSSKDKNLYPSYEPSRSQRNYIKNIVENSFIH